MIISRDCRSIFSLPDRRGGRMWSCVEDIHSAASILVWQNGRFFVLFLHLAWFVLAICCSIHYRLVLFAAGCYLLELLKEWIRGVRDTGLRIYPLVSSWIFLSRSAYSWPNRPGHLLRTTQLIQETTLQVSTVQVYERRRKTHQILESEVLYWGRVIIFHHRALFSSILYSYAKVCTPMSLPGRYRIGDLHFSNTNN